MANKITFQSVYNNIISGLFKTNTTKDIGSDDLRALVDSIVANNPFTDDDSYTWASPIVSITGTTTLTGTASPAITAYATGQTFKIKVASTSTGSVTLNLNAVGAKKVFVNPTTQAGGGSLVINTIYILVYDSALDSATGGFLIIGSSLGSNSSPYRGTFDASVTDTYPVAGTGSGIGGAIKAGDMFQASPTGDNTDYGGTMPLKTIFIALVDTPGSTVSNWRIW